MSRKSINTRLNQFVAIIVLLTVVFFLNYYLDRVAEFSGNDYHQILIFENLISEAILEEQAALIDPSKYEAVNLLYERIGNQPRHILGQMPPAMLDQRRDLFQQLYKSQIERSRVIVATHETIPELVASVRYIHEHHIGYLANLIARSVVTQDYDVGESFQRSPIHSASELDIIQAAVSIQTALLDIFKSFSALLSGSSLSGIKENLEVSIRNFYNSVNTFEDYSLDAQDGLLVEELLLKGRTFEETFTRLLTIERGKERLTRDLFTNSRGILDKLHRARRDKENQRQQIKKQIRVLQILALATSILLIVLIFYHGRKIKAQFQNTVTETGRIQNDRAYQIPVRDSDFLEFFIVLNALNAMAGTINHQFCKLEDAGNLLSGRVRERTDELVQANTQLKREMAERIQAERARQELEARLRRAEKMEAIGTLAGGVAHDLNNILFGLVSYPEVLLEEMEEDDPLRSSIQTIQSSGEKAAAIVQDLLTLARRGVVISEVINLNRVIRDYFESPEWEQVKRAYPGIGLRTHLDPELGNIMGSPVHLSKTIMNLACNAAEAMPDGGEITITTQNRYVDQPIKGYDDVTEGEYVALTVKDTGCGMAPEVIERIFEPFYTKKSLGRSGTGLGMAVVWGTVKDHNGYIDIISREGEGTSFTLYFPLTDQSVVEDTPPLSLKSYQGNGETILLVDDGQEQRDIGSRILEKLNYHVVTAASGEEAVEYLNEHSAHLIILDMIMDPGMDGLDTYKRILEIHPGQKAIIASGFSETKRVRDAIRLGVGGYIRKPYGLEKIGLIVREELKG